MRCDRERARQRACVPRHSHYGRDLVDRYPLAGILARRRRARFRGTTRQRGRTCRRLRNRHIDRRRDRETHPPRRGGVDTRHDWPRPPIACEHPGPTPPGGSFPRRPTAPVSPSRASEWRPPPPARRDPSRGVAHRDRRPSPWLQSRPPKGVPVLRGTPTDARRESPLPPARRLSAHCYVRPAWFGGPAHVRRAHPWQICAHRALSVPSAHHTRPSPVLHALNGPPNAGSRESLFWHARHAPCKLPRRSNVYG